MRPSVVLVAIIALCLSLIGCGNDRPAAKPQAGSGAAPASAAVSPGAAAPGQEGATSAAPAAATSVGAPGQPAPAAAVPPVNVRCPVCGDAIDPKIATITVMVYATNPVHSVDIGTCSEICASKVKADGEKYVPAALGNRVAHAATDARTPK